MNGVGAAFRELAAVFETLDTVETETEAEITAATPVEEDFQGTETVSVEVGMEIPLHLKTTPDKKAIITVQDAELTHDGDLRVTLQAAAPSTTASTEIQSTHEAMGTPPTTSDNTSTSDNTTTSETKDTTAATAGNNMETETSNTNTGTSRHIDLSSTTSTPNHESDQAAATSDEGADESPTGDQETDASSTESESRSELDASSESTLPTYRDPDRLQEVYETYDTFAEMTEALDVDVTSQTVRRYMIKHEIHEPASNTGSQTATVLVDMDPDDVTSLQRTEAGDTASVNGATTAATPVEQESPSTANADQESQQATDGGNPQHGTSTGTGQQTHSRSAENNTQSPIEQRADKESAATAVSRESKQSVETPDDAVADTNDDATDSQDEDAINASASGDENEEDETGQASVPDTMLPEHLTLAELKDIVRDAKTLYDVQQQAGLDRERARELLQELNLLDLVHGRLATRSFHERTIDEINRRIQAAAQRKTV